MFAEIKIDKIWIGYYYPGAEKPVPVSFPFLENIPPIVESTTAESGNAQIMLSLKAFPNLRFPLGNEVRIRDKKNEIVFQGVIADVEISQSIMLQLEA
jgi:hypothetical protein